MLANFVPADQGDAGHEALLREFGKGPPQDRTPHEKNAASPASSSTSNPTSKAAANSAASAAPTGMGVAFRSLCRVLDYVGIGYHLRDFEDVKAARGF